jgi:Zn finger protein HypA/HybF involved in hydrogenase expression
MVSDLSVVCRVCSRKVKMDQVKFDDIRKAYVCEACFASSHKSSTSSKNPFVVEAERGIDSLKKGLIKYSCRKCRYHFVREAGKSISVCPYCGSHDLDVLTGGASKIISDSDSL